MSMVRPLILLLAWLMLPAAGYAQSQDAQAQRQSAQAPGPNEQEWPCVQRLVPELSAGQLWRGPPLDEVEGFWGADAEIAPLIPKLTSLDTSPEEASAAIDSFAEGLDPANAEDRLRLLFQGVLEGINGERQRTINGIFRYASGQRALAEQISAENAELRGLRLDQQIETQGNLAEIRQRRDWDLRVFDARAALLTQLCDRPVMLEQRAFALARAIEGELP